MNVSLTTDLHVFVAELIRSGRYKSASEAIRAGLRLLQDHVERERRSRELQSMVREARASYESSGGIEADEVFAEIDRRRRESKS